MADRGRRARPLSSHLVEERYQQYCQRLHLERLANIKSRTDSSPPKTMNLKHMKPGNNHKLNYFKTQRDKEIVRENEVLLKKMTSITEHSRTLKPWSARSTLDYKPGYYYDPVSSQAFVQTKLFIDPSHPRGGRSAFSKSEEMRHIVNENKKLIRSMNGQKPFLRTAELEREDLKNLSRMRMISSYRGPESSRYLPQRPYSSPYLMSSGRKIATYNGPGALINPRSRNPNARKPPMALHDRGISTAPTVLDGRSETRPSTTSGAGRRFGDAQSRAGRSDRRTTRELATSLPPTSEDWVPSRGNSLHASAFDGVLDEIREQDARAAAVNGGSGSEELAGPRMSGHGVGTAEEHGPARGDAPSGSGNGLGEEASASETGQVPAHSTEKGGKPEIAEQLANPSEDQDTTKAASLDEQEGAPGGSPG
mmetsp:Transcript_43185/g.102472  ORF Transcript_43185/g.102472 Transcript_43185/m.102472 type:complete len:423 (+) Transcript_43185:145-1413(+)